MKQSTWRSLSPQQRHALLIAIQVRNAIEDFHVHHVPDAHMAELNQAIRRGIYDAIRYVEASDRDISSARHMGMLVDMIPDYWELPGEDEASSPAA